VFTAEAGHSPVKKRTQRKPKLNKMNRKAKVFHVILRTWKQPAIKGLRIEGVRD
jgi:hypothetical protein